MVFTPQQAICYTFDMEKYYSTKEVMEQTGLTKDALRYYEKKRIITDIKRDQNGYRQYSQSNIDWLLMIKHLKKLGISSQDLVDVEKTDMTDRLEYMIEYQKEVQQRIVELQDVERQLGEKIAYLKDITGRNQ